MPALHPARPTPGSISQILKAIHAPDHGSYGACIYCAHRQQPPACKAPQRLVAIEPIQRCGHHLAIGQPTVLVRGCNGVCGPDAQLHTYQHPTHQPGQASLALH